MMQCAMCNRLRVNVDKTQLVWLGTQQQLANMIYHCCLPMSSLRLHYSARPWRPHRRPPDVLTTSDHVATLSLSCLFQLRQLRMIRSSLTLEAAKTLVHAFISSRLDYCNSLLYGGAQRRSTGDAVDCPECSSARCDWYQEV